MPSQPPAPDPVEPGFVDLRDYLSLLKNRRGTVIVITLLTMILAGAYTLARTPIYAASATILVRPTGVDQTSVQSVGIDRALSLDTESQIARSSEVARRAAAGLGATSPESLLSQVSVEPLPDTQVLRVTFSDPDPARAQAGALAFAEAYLEFRRDEATRFITEQVTRVQEQIDKAKTRVETLNAILDAAPPGSVEARDAESEKATTESQIGVLQVRLTTLQGLSTEPGFIISRPALPTSPRSPRPVFDLSLGLILGLALGVGGAFVRDWMDDRVRDRSAMERTLSSPVLAVIPRVQEWVREESTRLVVVEDPWSPVSEAYRALRTRVQVAAGAGDLKTIMVVSPLAGEGKSTTAANLAVTLAQADKRVILISADLRKPRLHEFFGIPNEPGLSDVLLAGSPPEWALRDTGIENLRILPSGAIPNAPAELLQSEQARQTLSHCRDASDFVIVDCPPLLAVADSLEMVPAIDGVLLVAEAGGTPSGALEQARRELTQVGARILGGVLNNLDFYRSAPQTYGYHSYGEYGRATEAEVAVLEPASRERPGPAPAHPTTPQPRRLERMRGPEAPVTDNGSERRAERRSTAGSAERSEARSGPRPAPEDRTDPSLVRRRRRPPRPDRGAS
jgi:capsular exopolysaccharide synthesis family protein